MASDHESERQELLRQFQEREDPGAQLEDFAPGTFGCQEALHGSMMLADIIQDQLVEHPAVYQNPEWFALATSAVDALGELYQKIGEEHLMSPGIGEDLMKSLARLGRAQTPEEAKQIYEEEARKLLES